MRVTGKEDTQYNTNDVPGYKYSETTGNRESGSFPVVEKRKTKPFVENEHSTY
jgi:hypothetical protein